MSAEMTGLGVSLRVVVVDLTLLGFILELEMKTVVSYIQEVGFGRGQEASGAGLDREEPKL